jgi:hypothetical protein
LASGSALAEMELMEMSCRRPGEQVLRPELHLIRVGEDRRRPWTRTKCLLGGLIATLERSGFEVIAKGVLGASIISKSIGKPYAGRQTCRGGTICPCGNWIMMAVTSPLRRCRKSPAQDQPHAKQIAYAPQPPMRCADKEREPVPVARDAERPVSTARRKVAGRSQG